MSLRELLSNSNTTIADITTWLDGLSHAGRVEAMGGTTRSDQRRLWELAADSPPMTQQDFVPDAVADTTEVIHHGKNTLPVLNHFQKRFFRGSDGTIGGYNEGIARPVIGPGFFVAHDCGDNAAWLERGAWVVDYFQVPQCEVPAGWPTVRPNHKGLQVLVYHRTRDFMRKVSEHCSIGMAFKVETSMGSWFTLVREDPV